MTADTLLANEPFMQMYNAVCPMGRPGHRGELNGTILYFSSEAASYVTRQYVVWAMAVRVSSEVCRRVSSRALRLSPM